MLQHVIELHKYTYIKLYRKDDSTHQFNGKRQHDDKSSLSTVKIKYFKQYRYGWKYGQ